LPPKQKGCRHRELLSEVRFKRQPYLLQKKKVQQTATLKLPLVGLIDIDSYTHWTCNGCELSRGINHVRNALTPTERHAKCTCSAKCYLPACVEYAY